MDLDERGDETKQSDVVLKLIVVGRVASPLGNGQDYVLIIVRLLLCPDNFFLHLK